MLEFSGDFIKHNPKDGVHVVGSSIRKLHFDQRFQNVEGLIYSADIALQGRNIGRMIVKDQGVDTLFDFDYYNSWPEVLVQKHAWLKSHGLPVVPTLRVDVINNRVLMTDVSDNGQKKIVDKHSPIKFDQELTNRIELRDELYHIAANAYADGDGVFLGSDAYAIIVDKQGKGKVILLDIGLQTRTISQHFAVALGRPYEKVNINEAMVNVSEFLVLSDIDS